VRGQRPARTYGAKVAGSFRCLVNGLQIALKFRLEGLDRLSRVARAHDEKSGHGHDHPNASDTPDYGKELGRADRWGDDCNAQKRKREERADCKRHQCNDFMQQPRFHLGELDLE
jgi:hypothetical protein